MQRPEAWLCRPWGPGWQCGREGMLAVGKRGSDRGSKEPKVTPQDCCRAKPASLFLRWGQGSGCVTVSAPAMPSRPPHYPHSPFPFLPHFSASPWFLFPLPPHPTPVPSFSITSPTSLNGALGQAAKAPGNLLLVLLAALRRTQQLELKQRGRDL